MKPPAVGSAFEPLVSVVMPVYNRAPLIGRAVSSVLAQTYSNIEIIVVDDASTDALGAMLSEFARTNLRIISHSANRGAAAARNSGIASSRGEFVAFLDSDDVWYAGKLAHQVAAMRGQPSDVVGHICAYDCVKPGYRPRSIAPGWDDSSFRRGQLLGCTCGPGTTLLCRHQVFADVGLFDEELRRLEDWDWLLRVSAAGYRVLGSSEVLARVDVGSGGARSDIEAALNRIRERHQPAVACEGAAARRMFEASLHLEAAAAAFGDKAFAAAAGAVARSLAYYPLRGGAFYWWLLQRVFGRAGSDDGIVVRRSLPVRG